MNLVLSTARVEIHTNVPCNGARTTLATSGLHTDQGLQVTFPSANAATWTLKYVASAILHSSVRRMDEPKAEKQQTCLEKKE